jgi:CelD/BcsL family acetyltransferase involved in cellulose biosynthesis
MTSTVLFRTEAEHEKIERGGPIAVHTSFGMVQLRITNDLQSVETVWERLQAEAPCTSAQTFDWAQAVVRHLLAPQGLMPVIAVGFDTDGKKLFLWPFETVRCAGMTVLAWLGQAHANYNMGLFAPDTVASFDSNDISRLLSAVAERSGVAAAILKAQAFSWDGVANPFAKLAHQSSPSSGYAITLGDFAEIHNRQFSKRSRRTLDRKERKLCELGTVTYGWAETRDEKLSLVEILFAQKARQFANMGVKDIFDSHARAFYREVALLEGDNPSRLRLGYIKLADEVLATFCGTVCHKRLNVSLCSLADGQAQRWSPGGLLLRHQIKEACEVGLAVYDLGAGAGRHKDEWADVVQPLFDSFIAFKPQGYAMTVTLAQLSRLKRAIKSNPYLWPQVQRLRMRLFGKVASPARSLSDGSDAPEEF